MKKKIIIVGNGFASMFLIMYFLFSPVFPFFLAFMRKVYSRYEISVIGDGKFVYFPAIPEFLIHKKNAQGISVDIRAFLKRRNVNFIDDKVIDVQKNGRKLITQNGEYFNDMLFLGIGPSFLAEDIPGTKEYTYSPCLGPNEMDKCVAKLESLQHGTIYVGFKINRKDGFVSGRAGQMYECACLLDYALRQRGVRDKFAIHFFSSNITPGEKGNISDRLQERDIILDYGFEPTEFVEGGMLDETGKLLAADLVLYSPGITGPAWLANSCLPVTKGGQIDVDKFGQVKGLLNVFAGGDCGGYDNPPPWVPHQAHMAQLRAQAAAKNMQAVLDGAVAKTTYRHELSCIMNMENDAMWMHMAEDGKPPFFNIFPRRSKKLIHVKNSFEKIFLLYLKYL